MSVSAALTLPSPAPRALLALAPPSRLRAAIARLGTEELVLLERPAGDGARPDRAAPPAPRFDPLRAVHACWAPAATTEAWADGVVEGLRRVAPRAGWFARVDDASRRPALLRASGAPRPVEDGTGAALADLVGPERWRDLARPRPAVQLLSHRLRALPAPLERRAAELLASRGVDDALLVFAGEHGGVGIAFGVPLPHGVRLSSRTIGLLRHVAGHASAAHRVRAWLAREAPDEIAAARDAVDPDRSIAPLAVERLGGAGLLAWQGEDGAARLWAGLADGDYAVVDRWRVPGRARLLLRRCEDAGDPAALRPAEVAVLAGVARGQDRDALARELAITPATVALHLASARARLRCGPRRELLALLGAA